MINNTRKLVLIAIMVSLSVIIGVIDAQISVAVAFFAYTKLGLANIIVLLFVTKFKFKDCLILVILKSILVSFILGSLITFVISIFASLLSFIFMFYIYKKTNVFSLIGVSVAGSFIHITTQIIVVTIIYNISIEVISLHFIRLSLISLFTGVLIGFVTIKLKKYLDSNENLNF